MTNAPNSLQASDAEPELPELIPETAVGPGSDGGTEDETDLGGHTLLCAPQVPQGRRSLFRR